PMTAMLDALRDFPGLPHRCQWVGQHAGVDYYDDSKATNVGAALAAIEGFGDTLQGRQVLIAGGDGKGADFSPLCEPVSRYWRAGVLLGRDADKLNRCSRAMCRCSGSAISMRRSTPLPAWRSLVTRCCCRRPAPAWT